MILARLNSLASGLAHLWQRGVRRAAKMVHRTDWAWRDPETAFGAFRNGMEIQRRFPRTAGEIKRGLCIVRTQGKRNALLSEALDSLGAQGQLITPCVVFHGHDDEALDSLAAIRTQYPDAVYLTAPDIDKERGYPINVAFEYLREHSHLFQFVCFLDDDDLYYPTFAPRLTQVMQLTAANMIVCRTNSRSLGGLKESFRQEHLPYSALFTGNFIPINSYIVSAEIICQSPIHASEDMRYLEDWDLLISCLESGAKPVFLQETHSELRITGDGTSFIKNDPAAHAECEARVLERARCLARELGPTYFREAIADFDFRSRPPLTREEWNSVTRTKSLFERKS